MPSYRKQTDPDRMYTGLDQEYRSVISTRPVFPQSQTILSIALKLLSYFKLIVNQLSNILREIFMNIFISCDFSEKEMAAFGETLLKMYRKNQKNDRQVKCINKVLWNQSLEVSKRQRCEKCFQNPICHKVNKGF